MKIFSRRVRRRFVQLLGWTIGVFASLVAVIALIFAAYLFFFDYPAQLKQVLERELSRVTGHQARIDQIEVYLPNSFELVGVRLGPSDVQEEAVFELGRMRGTVSLGELVRLRLHWSELRVDGLAVRLTRSNDSPESPESPESTDPPGTPPAVPPVDIRAPLPAVSFSADTVLINDAVLLYHDEKIPLHLSASELNSRLTLRRDGSYGGQLSYRDGRLRVKERPEILASVDCDFALESGVLELHQFRAESEIGTLSANGSLVLDAPPIGRLDLDGAARVPEILHSLFGLTGLDNPAGEPLELTGALQFTPDGRFLTGDLSLERGRFHSLPILRWRSDLYWDRDVFRLINAEGGIAGGSASLTLEQRLPSREHLAEIAVSIEDASLTTAFNAWLGDSLPAELSVSGELDLSLRPSDVANTISGSYRFDGGPATSDESESLSGVGGGQARLHASGSIAQSTILVDRFELDLEATQLVSRGLYAFERGAELSLEIRSTNLAGADRLQRDVRRWLARRRTETPTAELWELSGSATAGGVLTGTLAQPRFEGRFRSTGLEIQNVFWGELEASGSLSSGRLHVDAFDLVRDDGHAQGRGEVELGLDALSSPRRFQLDAELAEWPLDTLTPLFGVSLPLSTSVSGDVHLARRSEALRGEANLRASGGELLGQRFEGLSVQALVSDGRFRVGPLVLVRGGGELGARLSGALDGSLIDGELTARSVTLESLPLQVVPGTDLSGTIDLDARLSGSMASPEFVLQGAGAGLRAAGLVLGDARWDATIKDNQVVAQFEATHQAQRLSAQIGGHLSGSAPLSGDFRFEELDLLPLVREPAGAEESPLRSSASGGGPFSFSPLDFRSLEATWSVDHLEFEGQSYRFVSERPSHMTLRDRLFELAPVLLSWGDSQMTLGGSVDVGSKTMDLQLGGASSFGLLEILYPSMVTAGDIELSARVTGSWTRPSLSGFATLKGGSLRVRGFPQPLSNLTGRLVFDNRTARLDSVRAVFGSAPVDLTGSFAMAGLSPESFDIRARGRELRLRYPEGFVASLDADLNLLGTPESQILGGDIVIHDAVWTREYDVVSNILSQRDQLLSLDDLEGDHPLSGLRFDIRIDAPGNLKVRNSLANIDANATLELSGNFRTPVLLGRSETLRGEIFFMGQKYDVTKGIVDFVDPSRVEPFFDLTAETRVRSYRVELRLSGTAERIEPELSSDPPLRTIDILRLLAGASERDVLIGTEEEEIAGVGVASLLTERLSQEVGRRAERLFGLDRFSIDPFLVGEIANPTARVSLGKQISRDVSINYSVNLNAATESIVLIEYSPDGPVSWILSRDETGALGVDMRFRKSF